MEMSKIKSVSWSLFGGVYGAGIQVIQILVLTRFLSPEDFSVFAICSVVIGFGLLFAQGGIGNAIIQKNTLTDQEVSSIFWFNLLLSMSISLSLGFTSLYISDFYGMPELVILIPLILISIPLQSTGRIYQALMQNKLMMKDISKVEVYSRTVAFVFAICIAYSGAGVYSLVYANLIYSFVRLILFILMTHQFFKLHLIFRMDDIRSIFRFSSYQLIELIFSFLTRNADIILITKVLDQESAGKYSLLKNLLMRVGDIIFPALSRYFYPKLSSLKNKDSLLIEFIKYYKLSSLMVIVAYLFVVILHQPLFNYLLPEEYLSIIDLLPLVCFWLSLRFLVGPISTLWLVKNKPEIGVYWNILSFIIVAFSILTFDNYSLEDILIKLLFAQVVTTLVSLVLFKYLLDVRFHVVLNVTFWIVILFFLFYFISYPILQIKNIIFILLYFSITAISCLFLFKKFKKHFI